MPAFAADTRPPCSGGCSTYSASNSVAVNCGGGSYQSTCGVQFLADETPCDPGDVIPAGSPYCRTNIKGPEGGYFYPTDHTVAGTADSTIFQVSTHADQHARSSVHLTTGRD